MEILCIMCYVSDDAKWGSTQRHKQKTFSNQIKKLNYPFN